VDNDSPTYKRSTTQILGPKKSEVNEYRFEKIIHRVKLEMESMKRGFYILTITQFSLGIKNLNVVLISTFIKDKNKINFHIFFIYRSEKNVPICHIDATPLNHFLKRVRSIFNSS
jgi:hypothetical protein